MMDVTNGSVWEHESGDQYTVVEGDATLGFDNEPYVVARSHKDNSVMCCSLFLWEDNFEKVPAAATGGCEEWKKQPGMAIQDPQTGWKFRVQQDRAGNYWHLEGQEAIASLRDAAFYRAFAEGPALCDIASLGILRLIMHPRVRPTCRITGDDEIVWLWRGPGSATWQECNTEEAAIAQTWRAYTKKDKPLGAA